MSYRGLPPGNPPVLFSGWAWYPRGPDGGIGFELVIANGTKVFGAIGATGGPPKPVVCCTRGAICPTQGAALGSREDRCGRGSSSSAISDSMLWDPWGSLMEIVRCLQSPLVNGDSPLLDVSGTSSLGASMGNTWLILDGAWELWRPTAVLSVSVGRDPGSTLQTHAVRNCIESKPKLDLEGKCNWHLRLSGDTTSCRPLSISLIAACIL